MRRYRALGGCGMVHVFLLSLALGAMGCGGESIVEPPVGEGEGEGEGAEPEGKEEEGSEPEGTEGEGEGAATFCKAGATQACACADGSSALQTCKADGSAWGECGSATDPVKCLPPCPPLHDKCGMVGIKFACPCPNGMRGEKTCTDFGGGALCYSDCNGCDVCAVGQTQGCNCGNDPPGIQQCVNGDWGACDCQACAAQAATCPAGQKPDPQFACQCFDLFRENVPCTAEHATAAAGIRVYQEGTGWRWATCQPTACEAGFVLQGTSCVEPQIECPEGQVLVGVACKPLPCPPDELVCQCQLNVCTSPDCGPEFCDAANDCVTKNPEGYAAKCVQIIPEESCETCHNSKHKNNTPGIEMPHVPFLKCTFCHLGDGTAPDAASAHVPRPPAMEDTWNQFNVQNPSGDYFNYLTHIGLEDPEYDVPATEEHEGLRWLQFVNPADIRVVDQACGGMGCHDEVNEQTKLSLMRTAAGVLDGARYSVGLARMTANLPATDAGARLATVGATSAATGAVTDTTYNPQDSAGTVQTLAPYPVQNRSFGGVNEVNLLNEAVDKACGECHIGAKGANRRYGDFRSGGCAACHILYADDGKSRSEDPLINKNEPFYDQQRPGNNDSYADIMLHPGSRPHPYQHRLTRKMPATQCGHCHRWSNWTVFQFKGLRVDINKDLATNFGCQQNGQAGVCRYDQTIYDPQAQKRRHGLSYHQIIEFEDLNADGVDDTPADVHWLAGMECIDCHTANEMHGTANSSIKSRMDQVVEVRCETCHGTVDRYVDPDVSPIKNIVVQGQGNRRSFYLKSKITGELHYIYQVRDSVWPNNGGAIDPRRGNPVWTPNADYAHGRWDGVADQAMNGRGIQFLDPSNPAAGETRMNFGHADTLECHACHSTWGNMCYGCHLTLADYDKDRNFPLNNYSFISGKLTPGSIVQFDPIYVSTLDLQIGINSRGKVSQFTPAGKLFFRYLAANTGDDFFKTTYGASYKTYRDRLGYGNRVFNAAEPGVGLAPQEQLQLNRDQRANQNSALAFNQVVPHTTQHKPRNCTACHVPVGHQYDPANDKYARQAATTWGVYAPGKDAEISAYLKKVPQVVQAASGAKFKTNAGFFVPSPANEDGVFTPGASAKFAGATAGDSHAHQLDWVVLEDGFTLASNIHTRIDSAADPYALARAVDRTAAGPVTQEIITKLKTLVRVHDMPGYGRVGNLLPDLPQQQ